MKTLVLLRHGESTWNREDRFTGWTDVPLSEKGIEEAREAGRLLREAGYTFDIAFTSVLNRKERTKAVLYAISRTCFRRYNVTTRIRNGF